MIHSSIYCIYINSISMDCIFIFGKRMDGWMNIHIDFPSIPTQSQDLCLLNLILVCSLQNLQYFNCGLPTFIGKYFPSIMMLSIIRYYQFLKSQNAFLRDFLLIRLSLSVTKHTFRGKIENLIIWRVTFRIFLKF